MAKDANGTEIHAGDVVMCRFVVANIIVDAERLNLLCAHYKGHEGLSDDFRILLEGTQCDVYKSADEAAAGQAAASSPRGEGN